MKAPVDRLRSASKYVSSSIRNKIIIPYVLLTIVLAAFGAFVVTNLVAGSFQERLRNQLLDAGRVVSDEVVKAERARLEVERSVANTIGVPAAIVERDFQQLDDLVSPIAVNAKNVDSIVIVDTQGREVLRLQRETVASNVPVRTYKGSGANFFSWSAVSQVLSDPTGRVKEVQLARDPVSDELIIYTVGPVLDSDGKIVGAVLVGTYLEKEIARLRSLALADITLFDETGAVVVTTFPLNQTEAAELFSFFTPIRYQEIVSQPNTTLLDEVGGPDNENTGGQTYRLAYAPFMLRDRVYGVYAVALPTNFITDTNNQSRTNLALIFSAGVVAVFWIGYAVSRRIIQPVIQLVQTSQAIAEGDLNRRTGVKSEDEIGTLAETFDHMTGQLQRLLKIQQEEASKLNAILNSIADGVIVQDSTGQILVKNPAAETILETMEEDFSYVHLQQTQDEVPPFPDSALASHWLSSLTGLEFHETQRFEVGQRVLSALSAPVLTPDGEQLGSVVVLRDITREVESERLKDDFITSVSHELRTPLTAIKGYNELLRMTAADKLDKQQLQFIDTIEENVADLLNVIQQMLDLSQIDAGELGIDQEPVDLSDLLETEAQQWQEKMSTKNLSFSTDLSDEPVWVEGDEDRLSRVIHNLLSNAHAYTLPGGEVKVSLKQEDGYAQVDVKDTGVGISTEDQRFLFKRFFRAIHEESTYEVSGAGLGLYVSKAIIEAHQGGKIWVETELNQGSTFSFALPLIDPAKLEGETEQSVSYLRAE